MQVEYAVASCLKILLADKKLQKVTKYVSPKLTVKVTRRKYKRGGTDGQTYLTTIGAPNYAERLFVKSCTKAGEPFPVRKVQLKFFN